MNKYRLLSTTAGITREFEDAVSAESEIAPVAEVHPAAEGDGDLDTDAEA